MFKKLKENFINVSLITLIILIVINAILMFYNRSVMMKNNVLQEQTVHVKNVWNSVFENNLRRMDMGLRGYALTHNEQLLNPYRDGLKAMPKSIKEIDSLLVVQELDSLKDQFELFKPKLEAFLEYMNEMYLFSKEDSLTHFVTLLNEDRGFYLWRAFSPMFSTINAHQDKLMDQAVAKYQAAMDRNVFFQVFLIVLTIPTLVMVMYKIKRDEGNRRKLLEEFEGNNKRYLFDSGEEIEADNGKAIIESSIANMKKASSFIKDIAQGNYAVTWDGLTPANEHLNQENIAGDLIKMRDKMKRVKELDEKRLWSTEGLAKFSDVARHNQNNIEMLSLEVVRFLTKHTGAQQGSLFVLHNEEIEEAYLKLTACYAFDKKKFVEKRVDIGSGLIGQAFLEGNTILLTDVPANYIKITSGLGDATPGCVIIVPMKYNERIEAVLELASFKKFEQHEIEFLEKAGEVIASSLYTTKTNERTAKLLTETQEQAEALRSQEEELRQNMEELQATQEDMRRREVELNNKRGKVSSVK
ncbi:CHASE3 domain-containing protein [Chryseosolibacter indicus]|uniref:CHASE3 domain-containing protein n=1 Tax=Chryseosolibacter indicus TaxID=2782351 RepID=A0ABS5VU54_9BACT|nr:CHASE3 domain-containing protein [Chryseosolibacter indicus]MBT1704726.1 CHASE3 domain-containing protein [Chryseosolibacter indicus]